MKENREALRKYLDTKETISLIATYEMEKKYKTKDGKTAIRKLFVKSYIEKPEEEYVGHIHIDKNDFVKRPNFKNGRKYRLTGIVDTYTRVNGSESLRLTQVTVEKL